ncbi:MAG TPA: hypothetical protein VKB96_12975 [Gammaproteobacteria bacterium]|nr:hypothetical protein [Gammaproteobacteria bacterium]
MQQERISKRNAKELAEGQYVLYWMQQAQRAEYNQAGICHRTRQ